jgi:hypothetical protein
MTFLSRKMEWATALVVAMGVFNGSAAAQGSLKCRVADNRSAGIISGLQRFMSSTDPRIVFDRDSIMHLPAVSANQVSLVTDERTCLKAVQAYATIPLGYTPVKVYVFKIGSKGYVVHDPDHRSGERGAKFVFNTKWVRTGGWSGG